MTPASPASRAAALALLLLALTAMVLAIRAAVQAQHRLISLRETSVPVIIQPRSVVLPSTIRFPAGDRSTALRRAAALLRRAAGRSGILIERLDPVAGPTATLIVAASGKEADLLRFTTAVESGQPAIRFAEWQLSRDDAAGVVRLDGKAVPAWQP